MEFSAKQLQIIEVAEKLFASKGFAGTSVRDIAHEADINVSMISYYFGSKEKLIEALFMVRIVETGTRLESVMAKEDLHPLQKVFIMIDGTVERLMGNQAFHNIMMREQLSSERTSLITDQILKLKVRNNELMKALIREGQDQGVFRKNIDLSLMNTTLYGTINQAIAGQEFYRKINKLKAMEEEEFQKYLRRKLCIHLKHLFKAAVSSTPHSPIASPTQ